MSKRNNWTHLIAGGVSGMVASTVTYPLDVIKTRMQSDVFETSFRNRHGTRISSRFLESWFVLRRIYGSEGVRPLFSGLLPTLCGAIPARAINFYVYANSKMILKESFFNGAENSYVHLLAAVNAGLVTATITNPIWMVKTRLQLQPGNNPGEYRGALHCLRELVKKEGVSSLYRGLSASYLGVTESTLQWVLYEYFKRELVSVSREWSGELAMEELQNFAPLASAAVAKIVATTVTYPHEVLRTRLRQAPTSTGTKYTSLTQCFTAVLSREGAIAFYSGLGPHLFRVVPSAVIVFGVYEYLIRLL
ncbi:mitochondrial carrier [Ascobolus immersus RN42]|uniref:Mitochondrial carrier n=1 Tax=Ascobolus immersus RN42 TaxID=1160509 RepID=A0A3N4I6T8_ASCIM|nr:mitochondrial carrier [Ascobolus immersus RN42]